MTSDPAGTVRVLVLTPGSDRGVLRDLERGLSAFQAVVGGFIERVAFGSASRVQAGLYLNEEGKLEALAVNGAANRLLILADTRLADEDYVVGTAFVVGEGGVGGVSDVPEEALDLARRAGIEIDEP